MFYIDWLLVGGLYYGNSISNRDDEISFENHGRSCWVFQTSGKSRGLYAFESASGWAGTEDQ